MKLAKELGEGALALFWIGVCLAVGYGALGLLSERVVVASIG